MEYTPGIPYHNMPVKYFSKIILNCIFFLGTSIFASSNDTLNPVIRGDFADPSVIRINDSYYAAGTSSEWAPHFPIYKSDDLLKWTLVSYVFKKKPAWMSSSFWAPELFFHNNKVFVYYTVRDTNGISCIGVATAESPEKTFTDHGPIIRTGKEAIDAFVSNDEGQLYVSWKAYGLDKRPIELLASKLSADGLRIEGDTFSLKTDTDRRGMEGQSMVKKNGYYYLFYSAGSCCGVPCSYNVRISRSRKIAGPYEEYDGNPILKENTAWMCTGHGTPVQTPDGRWFYMYHAYDKESHVYTGRQGLIGEIKWDGNSGWPSIAAADKSSTGDLDWMDDFKEKTLPLQWQWDFRSADISAKTENGNLILSGNAKSGNVSGTVISVRPVIGSYEILTEVNNSNSALKSLVLYGDANNSAGIGVQGKELIVWSVKKNVKEILHRAALPVNSPVKLKMKIKRGNNIDFFYSVSGNDWLTCIVSDSNQSFDGAYLKQWDRSPRAGLLHNGKPGEPAKFSYFSMITKF
jgi:beta-xylosidase